ncbi:MAG: hypothetical protein RIR11_1204 [Bacteroidota bacterium]|jgi:hypothetical protein
MQLTKTVLFIALLSFLACKNDPKTNSNAPNSATTPPSAGSVANQPEVLLYSVNVNNLQLRDQPTSIGSQVITKLVEGSFVTGLGEKSAKQEELELRGIPYKDFFYKVTSSSPEQYTGWLFGAALTTVYAGSKQDSPDLGKLAQLNNYLVTLNAKDLKSGKKAWDFVTANFADTKDALADASYILLSNFLTKMEVEGAFYTLTEKSIQWKPADMEAIYAGKFEMNTYPLTKTLKENGFRLETAEGMVFPIADWQKLYDFFGSRVSKVMKSYLDQNVQEQKDGYASDGGLIISVAQLAERAAFWEQFNKENPYFPMSENTRITEEWMRATVICGLNNTPTNDYETGKISEEFKQAWLMILQKYPNTKLAAKVKEISDLYAANNWKHNETIENWVTKFQETNAY